MALVGAWLAGPTRLAVRIRRALAPTFREHPVIIYSAVFLAALLALYFGPAGDTRRLFGILILGGLALLGTEALRRQTVREFRRPESRRPPDRLSHRHRHRLPRDNASKRRTTGGSADACPRWMTQPGG